MNSYQDNLWFLLDEWIHDAEIKCQEYDVQLFFAKEKSWTTYYSQSIILETPGVIFSLETLRIWKM